MEKSTKKVSIPLLLKLRCKTHNDILIVGKTIYTFKYKYSYILKLYELTDQWKLPFTDVLLICIKEDLINTDAVKEFQKKFDNQKIRKCDDNDETWVDFDFAGNMPSWLNEIIDDVKSAANIVIKNLN